MPPKYKLNNENVGSNAGLEINGLDYRIDHEKWANIRSVRETMLRERPGEYQAIEKAFQEKIELNNHQNNQQIVNNNVNNNGNNNIENNIDNVNNIDNENNNNNNINANNDANNNANNENANNIQDENNVAGDIELIEKIGKEYADNGEEVIRFNLAGSGYQQTPLFHKNISGLEDPDKAGQNFNDTFGTAVTIDNKAKKNLRSKDKSDKNKNKRGVKYYLAGPGGLNIYSDEDAYTMNALEAYIVELGSKQLEEYYSKWKLKKDTVKKIHLMFQGHSRGGVAAMRGAMKLNKVLYDKYKNDTEFLKLIQFDMLQFDPVPGSGDHYKDKNKSASLNEKEVWDGFNKDYKPLGNAANNTVIYSIHCNHDSFFAPMEVLQSERIILTPQNHAVNLTSTDQSQGSKKSTTYIYPDFSQGDGKQPVLKAYKGMALNRLPKGVFIADERNVLYKINSMEEYDKLVSSGLLKDTSTQDIRHASIRKAVESCLQRENKQNQKRDFQIDIKEFQNLEAYLKRRYDLPDLFQNINKSTDETIENSLNEQIHQAMEKNHIISNAATENWIKDYIDERKAEIIAQKENKTFDRKASYVKQMMILKKILPVYDMDKDSDYTKPDTVVDRLASDRKLQIRNKFASHFGSFRKSHYLTPWPGTGWISVLFKSDFNMRLVHIYDKTLSMNSNGRQNFFKGELSKDYKKKFGMKPEQANTLAEYTVKMLWKTDGKNIDENFRKKEAAWRSFQAYKTYEDLIVATIDSMPNEELNKECWNTTAGGKFDKSVAIDKKNAEKLSAANWLKDGKLFTVSKQFENADDEKDKKKIKEEQIKYQELQKDEEKLNNSININLNDIKPDNFNRNNINQNNSNFINISTNSVQFEEKSCSFEITTNKAVVENATFALDCIIAKYLPECKNVSKADLVTSYLKVDGKPLNEVSMFKNLSKPEHMISRYVELMMNINNNIECTRNEETIQISHDELESMAEVKTYKKSFETATSQTVKLVKSESKKTLKEKDNTLKNNY